MSDMEKVSEAINAIAEYERNQSQEEEVIEERNDLWWITPQYLTGVSHMVAVQFIQDETIYATQEEFVERATYVFRQHCPIAYSYIFGQCGFDHIPTGTLDIILEIIRQEKPLFLSSEVKLDVVRFD